MMSKLRTLIVDDDVTVARLHHHFVDSHPGFVTVGEAYTGAEALDRVEQLNPDVILLDVYLPDFSGLEVLARLRNEHRREVEVIAVTAARDLSSVRQARSHGVHHYLVKPFTATALRERLDEVVRHNTMFQRNAQGGPLDQKAVDTIILSRAAKSASLPKGLSPTTLALVAKALHDADESLASREVAAQTGISRVVARRYLEHLVNSGRASVKPKYGAMGRPENRYSSEL